MVTATEIRSYCVSSIIQPARLRGDREVRIRAGDVHAALGLKDRLPAVVAALGTETFCVENRLVRTNVEGPLNGASTVLVFSFH